MGLEIFKILQYQVAKNKSKKKFLSDTCKICGGLISHNGMSDQTGICKICGGHI